MTTDFVLYLRRELIMLETPKQMQSNVIGERIAVRNQNRALAQAACALARTEPGCEWQINPTTICGEPVYTHHMCVLHCAEVAQSRVFTCDEQYLWFCGIESITNWK